MNNNTNQTTNSKRGRDNTADFKPKRRNAKKDNVGLGIQPISIEGCEYALSSTKVELVKLDVKHLNTGIMERFNFINGSAALDAIMDIIDPTGEIDIDFKDYVGGKIKMNVEVVESGRFRNIIDAWAITTDEDENISSTASDDDEDDDYDYGDEETDDDELDLEDLLSDGEED